MIESNYNLFLDDVRIPSGAYVYTKNEIYYNLSWLIVRNYNDFIEVINKNGLPNLVSFDHDLAKIYYNSKTQTESFIYDNETGYDCAKWLIEYCINNDKPLPEYYCHSMNSDGYKRILNLLDEFKKYKKL